jgi:hypothetical protein
MPQSTTTYTDAQPDKSDPNGSRLCRHGQFSAGVIRSARFRLLAGGLTSLNGLPMSIPCCPARLSGTERRKSKNANESGA